MQDEGQRARSLRKTGPGCQVKPPDLKATVILPNSGLAVPLADSRRVECESVIVQRRLRLARAVCDVSSAVAVDQDFRTVANAAVAIMGLACNAECSRLYLFREGGEIISAAGEWVAGSDGSRGGVFQHQPATVFPWLVSKVRARESIQVGDVRLLPPEAEAERQIFQAHGIGSILAFPLAIRGVVAGFLAFENVADTRSWEDDDLSLVRTCAEIIAGVLERKRAEKVLRSERAQISSIFDSLEALVYISDPSTYELLYANKLARDAFGGHLVGDLCYRALQKADAPCSFCTNRIILSNGGKPHTWEHHNPITGRDYLVVDLAIKWADGRDVRFEFALDVTERKRSEEALKASEANYRAVFDMASDAIFVHDIETGAILDANSRMTEMFGYTREEARMLPAQAGSVGTADDIQRQVEARTRAAAAGEPQLFEWLAKDQNGREFWVEVNLKRATIVGQDRLLAVVRDISERKAQEERAREHARRAEVLSELSQFLAETHGDISSALKEISRRIAGLMGQVCVVRLVGEDEKRRTTPAIYYSDGDRQADLSAVINLPDEVVGVPSSAEALMTGDPVLLDPFPLESYEPWADPEWYNYVKDRGPYRALFMPLRRRGRFVGSIGILRRKAMPTFDDDDHTFLRHVADRVALAIVNLALYEDLQRELTERREAQSRFEMVIENTPLVAIRGFDLDGVVRHWNRASENLFGYAASEVTGHRVLDTLPVEAGHGEFETMFREVVGSGRAALPREREVVTKSGQKRTVYTTVFPLYKGGEPTEVFCMDVDITERKMQEEQLAHLATHDVLTGLPNRRSLEESLQTALALSRCGFANALIFVDVDNFKLVNDTLGHDAGDEMLVTVAGLLKDNLRGTDLLARLGGDEFAALLRDTSIEEAQVIAERLRRAVEESCFTVEGLTFDLSLSIGVVAVGNQATPALVLSQGDAAMYKAKNHGRNRLAVYDSEYDERTRLFEANREAAQIKDALRDDRLTLYYQPVVRLTDGSVAYYEALARLLAANGEALAAGAFIPTAERFGLIPQVTRLVVQQAVQALRAHPSVRLSVNLSGLDLCDAALPGFIEAYLRDQGVDPTRLGFEVTETALIKDLAQAERWIARIKSLGCRFALDDFGAGFVSFAYLRNLTVDQLKIDGSLVRALESDHTQSALVQALHLLATTQGKETVAECVENGNVVRLLKELGVTYGQGYHLGRPSPFLP